MRIKQGMGPHGSPTMSDLYAEIRERDARIAELEAALDDIEKHIRARRDGFRRFPARPCCAEENDVALQIIAETRDRRRSKK